MQVVGLAPGGEGAAARQRVLLRRHGVGVLLLIVLRVRVFVLGRQLLG
jgi:hypothetical protein